MSAIELSDITKIYPGGIMANENVNFNLRKGEVHALVGENGAGKTTLMKIMSGCLTPTQGTIRVANKPVEFKSPADALEKGIGMVHQHLSLIPNLTVLENIKLALSGSQLHSHLSEELERYSKLLGFSPHLDSFTYTLSIGERQRVEILRLLIRRTDILIFDEPTSLLAGPEIENFLHLLEQLSSEGRAIVLTTHKVGEAMQISDRVTVMRRGRTVETLDRKQIRNPEHLVELIIGEKYSTKIVKPVRESKEESLLIVRNITVRDDYGVVKVRNVTFDIHEGEVFGIAGVAGNGQRELVEAIGGLRKPTAGEITVHGVDGHVNYIPAERMELGVAPTLSVAINTVLRSLGRKEFRKAGGMLDQSKVNEFAAKIVSTMDIKTPSIQIPVRFLSGGNIQKLIVGREMMMPCSILIGEDPTAGLDAKSSHSVRKGLLELAAGGRGVLLVSADLDEILEISDRIGVMKDGELVRILNRNEANHAQVGHYMLLSTTEGVGYEKGA